MTVNDKSIICGVAIIRHGREFLISQRNTDDTFASFWEFPGGKVGGGESLEVCAVREVMEETGIVVRVVEKFDQITAHYEKMSIELNFYLCDYVSGKARALDCQRVEWVDVSRLKDYKFPPANDRIIEALQKRFMS